jgi:hypothetical protein
MVGSISGSVRHERCRNDYKPAVSGIGSGNTLTGACVHIDTAFMVSCEPMRQAITQQFITCLAHDFQCRDTGAIIGAHA